MSETSPYTFSIGSGGVPGGPYVIGSLLALELAHGLTIGNAEAVVGRSMGGVAAMYGRIANVSAARHASIVHRVGPERELGDVYRAGLRDFFTPEFTSPKVFLESSTSFVLGLMAASRRFSRLQKIERFHGAKRDGLCVPRNPLAWFTRDLPRQLLDPHFFLVGRIPPSNAHGHLRVIMGAHREQHPFDLEQTVYQSADPITALLATIALRNIWPSVPIGKHQVHDGRGPSTESNRVANFDIAFQGARSTPEIQIDIEPIAVDMRANEDADGDGRVRWHQVRQDRLYAERNFGTRTIIVAPDQSIYREKEAFRGHRMLDTDFDRIRSAVVAGIHSVLEGPASADLREVYGAPDKAAVRDAYHEFVTAPLAQQKREESAFRELMEREGMAHPSVLERARHMVDNVIHLGRSGADAGVGRELEILGV